MQQSFRFISTHHRRIENGWEYPSSYVNREIQIIRSSDYETLQIAIMPTLSPKRAKLEVNTNIFSGFTIRQEVSSANILKYIGDDPDYVFHIRNMDSFSLNLSPYNPASKFKNPIEIAFSADDDLIAVLERRDKNLIIEYYK